MTGPLVVALASFALAGAPSPTSGEPTAHPAYWQQNGCSRVVTRNEYRRALKRVYRYSHNGGDYRARPVKPRGRRRLSRMRQCSPTRAAHVARLTGVHRRKRAWHFHRRIDRATPFGEWAIPSYIVLCESRGNYRVWNTSGSDASGAYQFLHSTWIKLGGGRYARNAAEAPPWAQHLVAALYYRMAGSAPWSCA